MLKKIRQKIKANLIKGGIGIVSLSLGVLVNFSSAQAAMAVLDKANLLNAGNMLTALTKMTSTTGQINSQMMKMNMAVGSAIGPLQGGLEGACMMALQLAGGCIDNPLNNLKNLFLGLGKISPSFNFCDLLGAQQQYTQLLFIPFDQWNQPLTLERRDQIMGTRHQMMQQSSANTLAVVGQQRQELEGRQQKIKEKVGKGMNCTDMVSGMRSIVEVLGLIANDIVYMRLIQLQQAEMQATVTATHVPLVRG